MNRASAGQLARLQLLWRLTDEEVGQAFGVGPEQVTAWLRSEVPPAHSEALADLTAATVLLDSRLKRDRVAAVVRRQAPDLEGGTLVGLLTGGKHAQVRAVVERMLDLRRVQP